MARTIGIGVQSFEKIRERNYFYIDKTDFIREWWVLLAWEWKPGLPPAWLPQIPTAPSARFAVCP